MTLFNSGANYRNAFGMPLLLIALSILLMILGTWLAPGFASVANTLQLVKISSFLGLVAIGQTAVMLTGGIDLSLAWILTGSAVVYTGLCDGQDSNIPMAVVGALGVGLVTGLLNGLGVTVMKISPIIMTLAMNNIMLGATLSYTGGTPGGSNGPLVRSLVTSSVGSVPTMVILWCAFAAIAIAIIRLTKSGRRLLAVGENPRVSYLTGIANDRVVIGAYVTSGLMASITGILFAAFSGSSFLGMGDQFVLPSIVAVVLGGTSMFGGRGGYGGTMTAVLFTTVLTTVLIIENVSTGIRSIVFGVAILVAIIAQALFNRRGDSRE